MNLEPGMADSDSCRFCCCHYEKARPYVCPECFQEAQELMRREGWEPVKQPTNDRDDLQHKEQL